MIRRNTNRRGSAIVEFALASGVLIPAMAGSFQYGYTYYQYNLLQAAVGNGAHFAANRTYRTLGGASDRTKNDNAIKNMVVYGTPSPATGAVPLVKGLTTSNVVVTYTLLNSIPSSVKINITGFQINAMFKKYTFSDKPVVVEPFLGRYAPEESEP